ncbi:MAG: NUDIX hydrolase [Chloroflexi bacterium]|nr:NUDIX hydrolase [Chloroflexota bacterium]
MSESDLARARPEVLASRVVHRRWLGLRVDDVRYPSGREGTFDVVEHVGGITLVAFDPDDRLLLVRQYRHAVGRELLELPAGTLDPGESPEATAERELQEETGYRPERLERLGGFYTAPGYCTEYLHVFLATELVESRLEGDEEAIHVERFPLEEALRLIAVGEIEDAKTSGALLLYLGKRGSLVAR